MRNSFPVGYTHTAHRNDKRYILVCMCKKNYSYNVLQNYNMLCDNVAIKELITSRRKEIKSHDAKIFRKRGRNRQRKKKRTWNFRKTFCIQGLENWEANEFLKW